MQIIWRILLCLLPILAKADNVKNETDINPFIFMRENDYKEKLENHPTLLILALSRNCRLCYDQLPMYERARVELKQQSRLIPIGKYVIDHSQDQFAQQFNITTTPFFLLKNGDSFARADHFKSHYEIVNWVQMHLMASLEPLETIEQYHHISKKHLAVVIWFTATLADKSQTKFLNDLRGQIHFIRIYRSVSKKLSDFLNCPPGYTFIKYSGLPRGHCENSTSHQKIHSLLKLYEFEHDNELTQQVMTRAFREAVPLMIYISKSHDIDEGILSLAKFYQAHFKRRLIFCIAVLSDREAKRMLYYFRIHQQEGRFFLVDPSKRLKGRKFVIEFEGDFSNLQEIESFHEAVRTEKVILFK